MSGCSASIRFRTSDSSASRTTRTPPGVRKTYRMRDFCFVPSRHQCIRYVVSYPRLSRMTRRNGTYDYLRFCARAPDAPFFGADRAPLDAGLPAAARRGAGLAGFFAATFRLASDTGARARVRAWPPLAAARAGAVGLGVGVGGGLGVGGGVARLGAAGLGAATTVVTRVPLISGTAVR